MPHWERFLLGCAGSIAIEFLTVYQIFFQKEIVWPARFRNPWYYPVRVGMAVIAGGLAVVYEIETRLLAVHIGASAPLILQSLARGLRETDRELHDSPRRPGAGNYPDEGRPEDQEDEFQ